MSESVKFNFFYEGDKIYKVEIDQESRSNLDAERAQRFEDLITSMINGISETLNRGSKKIFEFGGMPKNIQNIHLFKLNSITTTIDYLLYLEEEREKNGDNGMRDHAATIAKIGIGFAFSQLGYVIGLSAFGLPGAFAGAVTMAITYDVKDIGGKTASEWIGEVAKAIFDTLTGTAFFQMDDYEGLYKDDAAIILGVGLQILLDAQDRGYILSIQNLDFMNYAQARVQEFVRSTPGSNARNTGSNTPSSAPNKGPTGGSSPSGNNPSSVPTKSPTGSGPTKGPVSGGTSNNPSASPTKGSSSNTPSRAPVKGASGNAPTNAPIRGSSSGNAPTASPIKGSSGSAPSQAPVKGSSGNAPANAPVKGSSNGNAPTTSPIKGSTGNTPSQTPAKGTSGNTPSTSPIKGSSNGNAPAQAPVKGTSGNTPTTTPIKGSNNGNAPTASPIKGTSGNAPAQTPTKAPTGGGQYNAPTQTPNPVPTPSPTPIKAPTQNFNNQPFTRNNFEPTFPFTNKPSFPWDRPTPSSANNRPIFTPTSTPTNKPIPTFRPSSTPTPSNAPFFSPNVPTFRPIYSPNGEYRGYNSGYRFDPFSFNRNSDPLFGTRGSTNGRVNDPTWLYSRGSTANGFDSYRSYTNARANFANSFGSSSSSTGERFGNAYAKASSGMNDGFANSQYGNNYGPKMADARGRASSARWAGSFGGSVRYAASHVSPLVFDLKCDGLDLLSYRDGVYFDIDNDGFVEKIGWTKAEDGQLARDLNSNGKIDDITELFGDDITSAFYKLAMLDSNNDRIIDKHDKAFHELLVWQDLNGNGYSEKQELKSLTSLGIKSISLKTEEDSQEIEGNLIQESSSFTYIDGTICTIADVHYHNDDMNSWYKGARKLEGDGAHKKAKKDIDEFAKYLFKELKIKLQEIYSKEAEEDWVREIIILKTEEYLEEIIVGKILKYKEEAIAKEFAESQLALKSIAEISDEKFQETIRNLVSKIAKDTDSKNEKAKNAAIKELQTKFQQQKDDIHSRYIQKLNQQTEELYLKNLPENEFEESKQALTKKLSQQEKSEKIKAQKKFDIEYDQIKTSSNYEGEVNSAKLKYLSEVFEQQKADVYASYKAENAPKIEAITKETKATSKKQAQALRAKYLKHKITESEYNSKLEKLKEKCEKVIEAAIEKINRLSMAKAKNEIEELRKEFRAKYLKEQNILGEKLVEEVKSHIEEEKYLNEQLYIESIKALAKFYFAQNEQKKADLKEYIEYLKLSIKEEANYIYEYVINESKFIQENEDNNRNGDTCSNQDTCPIEDLDLNAKKTTSTFGWMYNMYDYFFAQEESPLERAEAWLKLESYQEKTKDKESENNEGILIDPETLFMPMMRGYGQIPSLHIAMSSNPILKAEVMDFMVISIVDLKEIQQNIMNILYRWADVQDVKDDTRSVPGGANIEARKVSFIEKMTGQPFKQLGAAKFVGQHASASMQKAWDISLIRATKNLLIQGPLMQIFPKALYSFTDDEMNLNSSLDEILINAKKFATDNKLGYDFWVQIGYVLVSNIKELNIAMVVLKERLSELAGEPILVGLEPFSLSGHDDKNDEIRGTSGSDYIKGLGGNDKLEGKEGSDFIEGGEGDDEIYGGDGIDRLHGGNGNDRIYGGKDRDFIYGDAGSDSIYGEEGDDHIEGGADGDYIDGGPGKNTLSYGMSPGGVKVNLATGEASGFDAEGDQFKNFINLGGSEYDDVLIGDDQDNEINGEGGDDEIHGGKGNDQLFGAKGKDILFGEDGDDILTGFEGPDHMDGGAGIDTADYSHPYATVGVNVDLLKEVGFGGYAHGDTYVNIENIKGSKFNDKITGDNKDNKLEGMEGNDVIRGGDGNDIIIDPQGQNMLYGDNGDDYIVSNIGNFCFGGLGKDTISYEMLTKGVKIDMPTGSTTLLDELSAKDTFTEFENAVGTSLDDIIIGDDSDNKLVGLKGNDLIHGGDGNDEIHPGDGDDKVYGEKGNDHIMGSLGQDFYDGGEGIDTVDYSQELDEALYLNLKLKKMTGATFAQGDTLKNIERIIGTKFNDVMIGDDENNFLHGFDGDDDIYGGIGYDTLVGGKGKNRLYGEDGDDLFIIGEGENFVYGGSGINKASYQNAIAGVEIDLSSKQGKKSSGELDLLEDIHYCIGSKFNDHIVGDSGLNHLDGDNGDDYIDGRDGSDTIDGGKGNNILLGGSGNDRFLIIEGSNQVDGGSDIDTAIYSGYKKEEYEAAETVEREIKIYNAFLPLYSGQHFAKPIFPQGKGIIVSLATGIVEKPTGLNDQLTNVENVEGTHYDDVITGDDKDNILQGNNGNDIIDGGKGDDLIISGRGHSKLYGGEGNDMFKVVKGTADIYGGEGNDSVNLVGHSATIRINLEEGSISYGDTADCKFEGIEAIRTDAFASVIYDSKLDNLIETGQGNDIIYLSEGNDMIDSGDGDDVIYLNGSGEKKLLSGTGNDKFVIMPGFTSSSKTSVIIGDFKFALSDRIDLSNLANIKNFSDLALEEIELVEGKDSYNYSIIHIEDNKEIALFGVEKNNINEDCFIFKA